LAVKVINLHSRIVFWEKYHVTRREPLHLFFQTPRIGLCEFNAFFRDLITLCNSDQAFYGQ
jgi:hypothetical protein